MVNKKREREEVVQNGEGVLKHPPLKRAKEIDAHPPLKELQDTLKALKGADTVKTVVHWFRSKDLRQEDNKALAAASALAQKHDAVLLTVFLFSPGDLRWHGTSAPRTDFTLQGLSILQKQLHEKHIPLIFVTAEERGKKTATMRSFIQEHDVSYLFANFEYEVDELRRDLDLADALDGVSFELFHDQTVVEPGAIRGKSGPSKVFTPYHKLWIQELIDHPELLDVAKSPKPNDKSKVDPKAFESKVPPMPEDKQYASDEDRDRLRKLWPPGEAAGMARLEEFLQDKVADYKAHRSNPALDCTSRMSAYFSSGMVGIRKVMARLKEFNNGENDFNAGDEGIAAWVRELVFREFYRHTLVDKPHNSMNLPANLNFDKVQWRNGPEDEENYDKWEKGTTGFPFIDAGMRQLNHEFYLHNRLRMNVSSFLSGNLLIDYRRGERYFVEHLVDYDLANNTNGWEPSYTVFNPVVQAQTNDPNGDYIRRWVPELKDVKGKAVFMPFERLSEEEFEKLGYPKPCVNFAETAQRAKEVYKRDLHSEDPE